jgi:hypothetical protein
MCGVEMRDNSQIAYVCAIVGSTVTAMFVLLRLLVIFSPGGKQPGWEDALLVMCLVRNPMYLYRSCWLLTF